MLVDFAGLRAQRPGPKLILDLTSKKGGAHTLRRQLGERVGVAK